MGACPPRRGRRFVPQSTSRPPVVPSLRHDRPDPRPPGCPPRRRPAPAPRSGRGRPPRGAGAGRPRRQARRLRQPAGVRPRQVFASQPGADRRRGGAHGGRPTRCRPDRGRRPLPQRLRRSGPFRAHGDRRAAPSGPQRPQGGRGAHEREPEQGGPRGPPAQRGVGRRAGPHRTGGGLRGRGPELHRRHGSASGREPLRPRLLRRGAARGREVRPLARTALRAARARRRRPTPRRSRTA